MTVIVLCMESGSLDEQFPYDLAAGLELRVVDLRRLDVWRALPPDVAGTLRANVTEPESSIEQWTIEAHEQAARGDVLILGWTAAALLSSLPHVARVRIRAPSKPTTGRASRDGRDETSRKGRLSCAMAALRVLWLKRASGPTWRSPRDFDLVLDAARLSAADCQRAIRSLLAVANDPAGHSERNDDPHRTRNYWNRDDRPAASIGPVDVSLAGADSEEAAIARIERHLHGSHEWVTPADPLARKLLD